MSSAYPNLHVSDHPLVKHKATLLSSTDTEPHLFRLLVSELTELLVYEATRTLPTRDVAFTTPLEDAIGTEIATEIGLVPILRAGLGMVDAAGGLLPRSTIYHLGIYRDEESHLPVSYYNKLPSRMPDEVMILLDPMLATGGSASAASATLKANGVEHIIFVGLIAAPEACSTCWRSTQTCRSTSRGWTGNSTPTSTSAPASATPATGCSAHCSGKAPF